MKNDPYRLRQKRFAHLLRLGLLPAGVHLFLTLLFGIEADTSGVMLMMAIMAALAVGVLLAKLEYGLIVSALAAVWPTVLAAWRRWHWSLDMHSPGGAAQTVVRFCGWPDAPAAAALAAVLIPFGALGWLLKHFDRWYEKKTGRSLFEES